MILSIIFFSTLNTIMAQSKPLCASGVCLPENYNKLDMPVESIEIDVSLKLMDIYEINQDDFTMKISLFMELSWIDNRLILTEGDNTSYINLDVDFVKNIWIPDLFIYDLVSFKNRGSIRPQIGLDLTLLNNDSVITYRIDSEIAFVCPIDYSKYPFHFHICKLKISSFSKTNNSMLFKVGKKASHPMQLLDPKKIKGYSINVSYLSGDDTVEKAWSSDNYFSAQGLQIDLKSRSRKYIFIYFIPSTMFTFTSWVSYLLPPTSYPARTTLLVTVFLCQIGIFTTAIRDTPSFDGGMTSIESWCFACIAFTFGSLISYVIILFTIEFPSIEISNFISDSRTMDIKSLTETNPKIDNLVGHTKKKKDKTERNFCLEFTLFSIMAGSFGIFSVVYWAGIED